MSITRHKNAAALAETLATEIATACLKADKPFLILPGGQSAIPLMQNLATTNLPWNKITLFPTDERCVPLESPDSNAGQLRRIFGDKPVIHSLLEDTLDKLPFPATATILGMGPDGHFASLFPGMNWDETTAGTIRITNASKPPPERISLTPKTLLNTNRLILLAPGPEKTRLCEEILQGRHNDLPIARLIKLAGPSLEIHTDS